MNQVIDRERNSQRLSAIHRSERAILKPGKSLAKIPEFDILRSLAILLLFLHHGGIYNFSIWGFPLSSYNALFLLGSFVIISGYLSVRSLLSRYPGDFLPAPVPVRPAYISAWKIKSPGHPGD